ncbi:hypothetical protein ANO11243_026120 [Dothideomycetidae sp. 11243]|nr:hypothetical protein ANO11243_026120 [fungal sp. No.11243]
MPDQITTSKPPSAACTSLMTDLDKMSFRYRAGFESRASNLYVGEKAVSWQESQTRKHTTALVKQSEQCEKLVDATYKAMTEFGDVQNWAEMIERELLVLEETMRLVEELPESGNTASGT